MLPLDPKKKRVLYCPIEAEQGVSYSVRAGVCAEFQALLEREGFEVTVFVPPVKHEGSVPRSDSYKNSYDYVIYMANLATKSNQTTVRIEWQQPMGASCPHYLVSIPTIFISVENPYHLLDVPRVKTFINTYCSDSIVLEELMEKLMGRGEFVGRSPADLTREVRDTLNELRCRGYKLSIGSSSKNTKFILNQIGLGDFFDAIADGTDITRSKPDPEVFLKSAEKLGIAPADCVVVEDAKAGIEAAKAGGMTALALFGDAEGCGLEDYDLKSFSDLLNIL